MTDHGRHDELTPEDRAIDQALRQALATGTEPRPLDGGDGVDTTTIREYTELLGLLGYEVPAETPAPHLKAQILNRISGAAASTITSSPQRELDDMTLFGADPSVDSADLTLHRQTGQPEAVDMTLNQHVAAPEATAPEATSAMPAAAQIQPPLAMPSRSSWSGYAMAAVLAISLVGLGYLGALVGQQSQQIDQLQARLGDSAPPEEVVQAQRELATLRSRLDMVTTVARKAYPMRRVNQTEAEVQPEGIVYVCGRHQQWYLSLRGLEPPAKGREYHVWFMTEQGKIDGGALDVRDDTSSEMEALSMPDGTHGFLVTLEPTGPSELSEEPESLTILLGERAINL